MEFIFIITAIEDFIEGNISFEKFKEESDKNYEHYCNQGEKDVFLDLIHEPLLAINKNVTDNIFDEKWGMCTSFFKENY